MRTKLYIYIYIPKKNGIKDIKERDLYHKNGGTPRLSSKYKQVSKIDSYESLLTPEDTEGEK